jgi:hypothetical protein
VISIGNAFILNTRELSIYLLEYYGLEANDVLIDPDTGYYDHLPIIVDFSLLED